MPVLAVGRWIATAIVLDAEIAWLLETLSGRPASAPGLPVEALTHSLLDPAAFAEPEEA